MHPALEAGSWEDETRLRLAPRSPEYSSGLWPAKRRLRGASLSLSSSCLNGTAELQKKPGVYPRAAVDVWVGGVPRGAEKRAREQRQRQRQGNEKPYLGLILFMKDVAILGKVSHVCFNQHRIVK